jgi:hypothetical protein
MILLIKRVTVAVLPEVFGKIFRGIKRTLCDKFESLLGDQYFFVFTISEGDFV